MQQMHTSSVSRAEDSAVGKADSGPCPWELTGERYRNGGRGKATEK